MNEYELVIGLEIHVELKTKSGMFCACPADHFGKEPNTQTCPVCLGLPGALPVPNKHAIDWTIMLGLAIGSDIAEVSKFDRKHYFYPDLPKGYQISQYDQPLCTGGVIQTSSGNVRIHRVHLEEDTGKLQHTTLNGKRVSLVDFNRSGAPLMEIVTEPDIHSSQQAKEFLKTLHQIVRFVGISDADMEKGSMRLEPNISVRIKGSTELPNYKVEVKNINSFKFAVAAIEYEFKRHIALLEIGETPVQETRGWNEDKNITVSQRVKEGASDYRYFPEPDIPPLRFTKEYVEDLRAKLPPSPDKVGEVLKSYGLGDYEAKILIEDSKKRIAFQSVVSLASIKQANISGPTIAKWIINKSATVSSFEPTYLADQIIASQTVQMVDPEKLASVVSAVLGENPKAVSDYKSGKETVIMFLMGKVRAQLPIDTSQILAALKKELAL